MSTTSFPREAEKRDPGNEFAKSIEGEENAWLLGWCQLIS